jgi:hypothetical protein
MQSLCRPYFPKARHHFHGNSRHCVDHAQGLHDAENVLGVLAKARLDRLRDGGWGQLSQECKLSIEGLVQRDRGLIQVDECRVHHLDQ